MQQQDRTRTKHAHARRPRSLRGDSRYPRDAGAFSRRERETRTSAEGPAHDYGAGCAKGIPQPVEAGLHVRHAVLRPRGLAVVQPDHGDVCEESDFIRQTRVYACGTGDEDYCGGGAGGGCFAAGFVEDCWSGVVEGVGDFYGYAAGDGGFYGLAGDFGWVEGAQG